jgi:HORMA domain
VEPLLDLDLCVQGNKVTAMAALSTFSSAFLDAKREEGVDFILSFLEVAVHSLLFARKVYPEAIFERRKEYGIAVWQSRHPGLNLCINEALANMRSALLLGIVEAVVMLIFDSNTGSPLEQYIFRVAGSGSGEPVAATYSDLETMFASALLRISMLEMQLPPLPAPAVVEQGDISAASLDGSGTGLLDEPGEKGPDSYSGGTSFTLLLRTHETLVGPNDSGDYQHAAGSASGGLPWTSGILGTSSTSSSSSSSAASAAAATAALNSNGYWMRVDPGDAEAQLSVKASAAATAAATATTSSSSSSSSFSSSGLGGRVPPPSVVSMPLKSIRAGELALDVSVEYDASRNGLMLT